MGTKRIALNVVTTYAQTALSLAVGFFTSRWIFNALGAENFGLFAVVGALITFVAFLNNALIGASGRFFALAVGEQRKPDGDKELLCKWFNTALSVQLLMPIILIIIGGPIGVYAILNWMTIPDTSRMTCVWVFGLSLFTMFQSMLLSPAGSLYYAKQYVFVRTLFSVLNTFVMAAGSWWLLHYQGNRLLSWAVFSATVALVNGIVPAIIAYWQFPEARIRPKYWFDKARLKEMASYVSFNIFGNLGGLFSGAGVALVLNKFFDPVVNAAMGIGNNVNQKTSMLSQAFTGAMYPEIITRVGAGDVGGASRLAYRVCVYSSTLSLMLAMPVVVYVQKILVLWLKHPAHHAAEITVIMIACLLSDCMSNGYVMLIQASGRIKAYIVTLGSVNIGRCLAVFILLWLGVPLIPTLWLGWFLPFFMATQSRVWFVRRVLGHIVSIRHYFMQIWIPVFLMIAASFVFSFGFKALFGDTIPAMLLCLAGNVVLVATLFWIIIDANERSVIRAKISAAYATFF